MKWRTCCLPLLLKSECARTVYHLWKLLHLCLSLNDHRFCCITCSNIAMNTSSLNRSSSARMFEHLLLWSCCLLSQTEIWPGLQFEHPEHLIVHTCWRCYGLVPWKCFPILSPELCRTACLENATIPLKIHHKACHPKVWWSQPTASHPY